MSRAEHLATLLRDHEPRDAEEIEDRERTLALVDDGEAAFDRHRYTPGHVTASAFVIAPDAGEVLLIHHGKLALWLQPGGHVDPTDRDVVAAAQRELKEEAGLLATPLPGLLHVDVHAIPARGEQLAHEHFDVRLLFAVPRQALTAGSDALDARWVALEALDSVDTDASVRRAVAAIPDHLRRSAHMAP